MIHQMSACAHQRTTAWIHVRIQRDIAEGDIRPRSSIHPFPFKSRPGGVRTARNLAIGFRVLRAGAGNGSLEMLLIPDLRAEGFFPVHVYMVESFRRHVSLILDDR